MHPGSGSRVGLAKAIGLGFRFSRDPPPVPHLTHQTKPDCEDLYIKATINQFILVARNYPVAIVGMICLSQSVVNRLSRLANCMAV